MSNTVLGLTRTGWAVTGIVLLLGTVQTVGQASDPLSLAGQFVGVLVVAVLLGAIVSKL